MTDRETGGLESLASHGFRLSARPDELEVARDATAYSPSQRVWRWGILLGAVILTAGIYFKQFERLAVGHPRPSPSIAHASHPRSSTAPDPLDVLFSLIWPAAPLLFALRALYPGLDSFLCTQESLEVKHTLWGKARNVRVFQAADVTRLQYVVEIFPWLGTAGCMGFLARGKQVTCLSGLKHSDVRMILTKLGELGYDVVPEPEIPTEDQFEESSNKE